MGRHEVTVCLNSLWNLSLTEERLSDGIEIQQDGRALLQRRNLVAHLSRFGGCEAVFHRIEPNGGMNDAIRTCRVRLAQGRRAERKLRVLRQRPGSETCWRKDGVLPFGGKGAGQLEVGGAR